MRYETFTEMQAREKRERPAKMWNAFCVVLSAGVLLFGIYYGFMGDFQRATYALAAYLVMRK